MAYVFYFHFSAELLSFSYTVNQAYADSFVLKRLFFLQQIG